VPRCQPLLNFRHKLAEKGYPEHYRKIQEIIYGEETLNAHPIRGALTVIKKLIKTGHEIFIITRRTTEHHKFAEEWLRMHSLSQVPLVIVNSVREKTRACEEYAVKVYLDNDPEITKELVRVVPYPILFDPYGIASEEQWNRQAVRTWKDFLGVIDNISARD